MKKISLLLVAAAFALATAGTASARSAPQGSRILAFASVKRLLTVHSANPKPVHQIRQSNSSMSIYERTTKQWILRRQGCGAGKENLNGVVILDFGKLAYNGHTYGTILFSNRFAANRQITKAMLGYAAGYNACLPKGSLARIELARGTSNYHPAVPNVRTAGRLWARETSTLAHFLYFRHLDGHVWSAAADDAEPAWDPHYVKTRNFFLAYRKTGIGRPLYN
ncbi:MAG: hypothetical protein ACRDLK_05405, partial [Gaiellaceae bacterium]